MSGCSRGISYATLLREPTQTECFVYDVWNKSCPGALIRLLTLALGAAGILLLLSALVACHKEEKAASQAVRPVRTVTVELQEGGEKVSLTGEIRSKIISVLARCRACLCRGPQALRLAPS